jgi:hypothetical protein
MNIVKRIFGALFALIGLGCIGIAVMLFGDGNKHDALGWGGGGGAALFFALILVATSFGKKTPPAQQMQRPYPQQGYPQQPPYPPQYPPR